MADLECNSDRNARKCAQLSQIFVREEIRAHTKKVAEILKKNVNERTPEEKYYLDHSKDTVKAAEKRAKTRQLNKDRKEEVEDPPDLLTEKCAKLADAIRQSKRLVVYTGAGISTAASIPDYRGPNGIWTLLEQGKEIKAIDLSDAQPTHTHMAITKLYQEGYIKLILSQNCDGLHLRSGLPMNVLSEVHGNMFIELCRNCDPQKVYVRLFDVTENTGFRKHKTGRMCHSCGEELRDSIVHFGEKGGMATPYNWHEVAEEVDKADTILCLGSSLKVLKKYPCLWSMHKPAAKRPKLYIVNLQWTPRDDLAVLKINGKCDEVLQLVMSKLGLKADPYNMEEDPIFGLVVPLKDTELCTTKKKMLVPPANLVKNTLDKEDTVRKKVRKKAAKNEGKIKLGKIEKRKSRNGIITKPKAKKITEILKTRELKTETEKNLFKVTVSKIAIHDHTYTKVCDKIICNTNQAGIDGESKLTNEGKDEHSDSMVVKNEIKTEKECDIATSREAKQDITSPGKTLDHVIKNETVVREEIVTGLLPDLQTTVTPQNMYQDYLQKQTMLATGLPNFNAITQVLVNGPSGAMVMNPSFDPHLALTPNQGLNLQQMQCFPPSLSNFGMPLLNPILSQAAWPYVGFPMGHPRVDTTDTKVVPSRKFPSIVKALHGGYASELQGAMECNNEQLQMSQKYHKEVSKGEIASTSRGLCQPKSLQVEKEETISKQATANSADSAQDMDEDTPHSPRSHLESKHKSESNTSQESLDKTENMIEIVPSTTVSCAMESKEQNLVPSVPGWYGKGLKIRKKRVKSK